MLPKILEDTPMISEVAECRSMKLEISVQPLSLLFGSQMQHLVPIAGWVISAKFGWIINSIFQVNG